MPKIADHLSQESRAHVLNFKCVVTSASYSSLDLELLLIKINATNQHAEACNSNNNVKCSFYFPYTVKS
jgi:hypothetical protein